MQRREFLRAGAAAAVLPWGRVRASSLPQDDVLRVRPFPPSQVRLTPGSFLDATQVNRRFVMNQDPDRLLHTFRLAAGLPSNAAPLGGWEAPENELRGHYTGHHLSACARLYASQGDSEVKRRGDYLVAELARCQDATQNGYLSAFPEEFFDRLREGRPVWAPFYTVHKIMAGLLDMHQHAGNRQALAVLERMAGWAGRWTQPLGEAHMARVLEREYGGMNELLYNLAAVTGNRGYRGTARRFDHERVFGPLAEGRDELRGLHVNTTIPKIIGAARRYELTGERRYRRVAEYFWREVTSQRSYCTGGTSNGEGWNAEPGALAGQLSGYTQESCVTYNMLKLTRHVFGWTADPLVADYYERALLNGILGAQHPSDGSKLYYMPLSSGLWKLFGAPEHDYWCCTGSMTEIFGALGESIYFQDDDGGGVYVNLFVASELDWADRNVRLVQDTRFPNEDTTTLTVRTARPAAFALKVRVPSWSRGGSAQLNGRPSDGFAAPGGYLVVQRSWRDGDRLEVRLPQRLTACAMPDDPTLQAFMYGPLVLAGKLGTEGLTAQTLRAEPTRPRNVPRYPLQAMAAPELRAAGNDPARWISRVPGPILEFRTTGQAADVTLVPLNQLFDERYAVYWKVGG